MDVFKFDDYKLFLNQKLRTLPKRGHGQMAKIAKLLGVHSTMVTHIFKGSAHLSIEQGLKLAEYLGLNELETEYFITLVQQARASNSASRHYFEKHLARVRDRALNLSERFQVKETLDESDRAIFYSDWKQRFKKGRFSPVYRDHGLEMDTGV